AKRVRGPVEADMRVAELREAKRRRRLTIRLAHRVGDGLPEREPGRELIQRRRAQRGAGNPKKRAAVEDPFHRNHYSFGERHCLWRLSRILLGGAIYSRTSEFADLESDFWTLAGLGLKRF